MTPRIHKVALTAHVIFSVGWLGAVIAYLPLAVQGLRTADAEVVRSAYLAMEQIGWFVVVPLCLLSLVSRLIQSVGTEWGLFRRYWIVAKFVLTVISTVILLSHMPVVSRMARLAATMELPIATPETMRTQLVVYAAGGLVVLVAITVLSIFKPWGRIRIRSVQPQ
jgi:hypothetical protein